MDFRNAGDRNCIQRLSDSRIILIFNYIKEIYLYNADNQKYILTKKIQLKKQVFGVHFVYFVYFY